MTKSRKSQRKIWCFIREMNLDEYPRHSHRLLFLIWVIIHSFTRLAWGSRSLHSLWNTQTCRAGLMDTDVPKCLRNKEEKCTLPGRWSTGSWKWRCRAGFYSSGCFVPWRFPVLELPQCSTGMFQLIKNNNWRKGHLQGRRKMIQSTKDFFDHKFYWKSDGFIQLNHFDLEKTWDPVHLKVFLHISKLKPFS